MKIAEYGNIAVSTFCAQLCWFPFILLRPLLYRKLYSIMLYKWSFYAQTCFTIIFSQVLEPDNFQGFNQTITPGLDIFTHMHYSMTTILAHQLNFK